MRIDTFTNPSPAHDYTITIEMPEFTCLCPLTGQPDFAHLSLVYNPKELCIELKSIKNYIVSFRNRQAFHEAVTNEIINHLYTAIKPKHMTLTARFNMRGGITTTVTVSLPN